jgi:uncharacterized protein (TIGR02270 family)
VGIAACAAHRVDPGEFLGAAIRTDDPVLLARAAQSAGELGRTDLLPACLSLLKSDVGELRFQAAAAALLLGDRGTALRALAEIALAPAANAKPALCLYLRASGPGPSHDLLLALRQAGHERAVILGAGVAGDPKYLPWLLGLIRTPASARLAGEAFSTITGLDLFQGFDQPRPEDFASGPSDNPQDEDVDLDPDEHLPWPDADKVERWWAGRPATLLPEQRYFLGKPPTPGECIRVLHEGYQRARNTAAQYLSLFQPGRPLFNAHAVARRQQRALARE